MSLVNTGGDSVQLKPDQLKVLSPSVWNTTASEHTPRSCPSVIQGVTRFNSNQIKSTTIVLSTCYFYVATPTTTAVWKSVYQVWIVIQCIYICSKQISRVLLRHIPYGEKTPTTNHTGRQPLQHTPIMSLSNSGGWLGSTQTISTQSVVSLDLKHNRLGTHTRSCPSVTRGVTRFNSN